MGRNLGISTLPQLRKTQRGKGGSEQYQWVREQMSVAASTVRTQKNRLCWAVRDCCIFATTVVLLNFLRKLPNYCGSVNPAKRKKEPKKEKGFANSEKPLAFLAALNVQNAKATGFPFAYARENQWHFGKGL